MKTSKITVFDSNFMVFAGNEQKSNNFEEIDDFCSRGAENSSNGLEFGLKALLLWTGVENRVFSRQKQGFWSLVLAPIDE